MLLSLILSITAYAAPEPPDFIAPDNALSYTFSVPLQVNIAEPYAGIQFKMERSSTEYLTYTFTPGPEAVSKGALVYKPAGNPNSFGYYCYSNAFSGNIAVGTLEFTYTGNAPQFIHITEMKIIRIKADGKTTEGILLPPPVEFITVAREGSNPHYRVIFNPAQGVRTGGGALAQMVPAGGGAVAPELTRVGYDFVGWDKDFSKVTEDITVTALWTESATPPPDGPPPGGPTGPVGPGGEDIEDMFPPPLAGLLPFSDVRDVDWFYDDIVYVYDNGLMNGVSDTLFGVNTPVTRGMIVTILGRQYGVDIDDYPTCAFSDVNDKAYFAPYIEWARQNDIVKGVSADRFAPERAVSRQDIATIFFRYADFAEFTLPKSRPYADFADEASISDYANKAVQALFSAEVINGKSGNRFDPRGATTRAEAAAMMHRFLVACLPEDTQKD